MKTIPLTQGKVALVDDEDFEALSAFKWYADKKENNFYAARNERLADGSRRQVYMHRVLAEPGSLLTDHRDGNGLNNQRYNLRPASNSQNQQSFQRKRKGSSSVFRGVRRRSRDNFWHAYIRPNGRQIHLGSFESEEAAARAFDAAACQIFGEFASLNFPSGNSSTPQ